MKRITYILVVFCLTACAAKQKISYSKEGVVEMYSAMPIDVDIRVLTDGRATNSDGIFQASESNQTKKLKKMICINSEKYYGKDSVVFQISREIAEHFKAAKLFRNTTFNTSESASYYLIGNLLWFYGEQDYSMGAAVGAQFGLIGALSTMNVKTPGAIKIEISDLALYNRSGEVVKEFGSFSKEYVEEMPADAYCWCMYRNINEKLKDFNQGLSEKIKAELVGVVFD